MVALVYQLLLLSHASTSLMAKEVEFITKGNVLKNPQLSWLEVTMEEVNFDQKGFSVFEVNELLLFLHEMQPYAIPLVKFDVESDTSKYSLMLRFAHSLNSKPLFEFVARDIYYLLGLSVVDFMTIIPGMRSATFEPILFRVYLGLSSGLSLEQRVGMFSQLIYSVRPDFRSLEEFFSFDYKVIQVGTTSQDWKFTEWTVEIEGQFHTSFFIGNYDSEEWHLKFVDGNPHFELAKFLVTNSTTFGHSNLATLFSALARRDTITTEEREAALLIAFKFQFTDALKALRANRTLFLKQPDSKNDEIPQFLPNRIRKRTDGNKKPGPQKKRRIESTSIESASVYFTEVRLFQFGFSDRIGYLSFGKARSRLFNHLKENLGSVLNPREGKLEFTLHREVKSKTIKFPDLSFQAVKSFLEVDRRGLLNGRAPPTTKHYEIAREIPDNEEEQKELMSQVAQMVCAAIRLKFDEEKFFNLLDWYKESMKGVWEKIPERAHEFVKEVDEARKEFYVQTIPQPDFQNLDQEKPFDTENSLTRETDDVAIFKIVSANSGSLITVRESTGDLFSHLKETFWTLKVQKGKMEFDVKKISASKIITLPDLSWEAVRSYVAVTKRGLLSDRAPPPVNTYRLKREIPDNEEEQKKLMIQVAQMVCAAIRFKFDEEKLFSLLNWYEVKMGGVWEELLQSGNEFIKEVDAVKKDFVLPTQDPAYRNPDHEAALQHLTDNVKRFNILSRNSKQLVTVQEVTGDLFPYLKESMRNLKVQHGKMEFDIKASKKSKKIKLPDLSYEAVRSYVTVTKRGLVNDRTPPGTCDYKLARKISKNEEEQKELMIQVAEMVCAAIRFKFDEEKLLTLLDWYKEKMEGVWEKLLKSENSFVREVEEFRHPNIGAQIALADDESFI